MKQNPAPTRHDATGEKGGVWIGGIDCGRRIAPELCAEEVASRRHVIRNTSQPSFARRLGEVFGGGGHFQACRMNGDHVGIGRSLLEAAQLLA